VRDKCEISALLVRDYRMRTQVKHRSSIGPALTAP